MQQAAATSEECAANSKAQVAAALYADEAEGSAPNVQAQPFNSTDVGNDGQQIQPNAEVAQAGVGASRKRSASSSLPQPAAKKPATAQPAEGLAAAAAMEVTDNGNVEVQHDSAAAADGDSEDNKPAVVTTGAADMGRGRRVIRLRKN